MNLEKKKLSITNITTKQNLPSKRLPLQRIKPEKLSFCFSTEDTMISLKKIPML